MTASLTDAEIEQRLLAAQPRLRRFLARLHGGGPEVDDLVQETMTRAWRSRHRLDPERPAESWLLRIGFRTWLDHRACGDRAPAPLQPGHEPAHVPGPSDAEVADELAVALARLSDVEREVLLRRHRDGLSIEEIGAALRMPLGTVKSHLHRARRKLPGGRLL